MAIKAFQAVINKQLKLGDKQQFVVEAGTTAYILAKISEDVFTADIKTLAGYWPINKADFDAVLPEADINKTMREAHAKIDVYAKAKLANSVVEKTPTESNYRLLIVAVANYMLRMEVMLAGDPTAKPQAIKAVTGFERELWHAGMSEFAHNLIHRMREVRQATPGKLFK